LSRRAPNNIDCQNFEIAAFVGAASGFRVNAVLYLLDNKLPKREPRVPKRFAGGEVLNER
jgi:hypothetical protein